MTSGIFHSSRLKIERANKHIQELCSVVGAFFQTDFYRITIENNRNKGLSLLTLHHSGTLPPETPLIIGDVLHNLRTALDLAICYAIRLGAGTPSKFTRFPFAKNVDELVGPQKKGKIQTHCPVIFDLIVNKIKPYYGGNDALCALNDLDIMDKHRLLIPAVSIVALRSAIGRPGVVGFPERDLSVRQGSTLRLLSNVPDLEITDYRKPTFDIFFDRDQILEGQPIIPTLHQFSQLVSGIIDMFRDVYIVSDKTLEPPSS